MGSDPLTRRASAESGTDADTDADAGEHGQAAATTAGSDTKIRYCILASGKERRMATVRATVEVFGQRLGLRADGDADRLQEIARFVDSRMREVADRSSSVDTVKIAVLTALNIADELFQERETDQDVRQKRLEKQAERLVTRLDEAMKPDDLGNGL
jgi:cell division protein ZapA